MGEDLASARTRFFDGARNSDGAVCPCCDRFGKVYVRKFNRGMALTLIFLYRYARKDFVHLPSTAPRKILTDNQVGKLVFWGMAQQGERRGYWKITQRGVDFVEGKTATWSHVVEYNHKRLEFKIDKGEINISGALGSPFRYQELMREAAA